MAARGVVGFAATVWVIDGVHGDSARLRALALCAVAARLADLHVLVLGVGERPDGCTTLAAYHPHLARGEAKAHHRPLLGNHLDRGAGGASEPPSLPGDHLDVVD